MRLLNVVLAAAVMSVPALALGDVAATVSRVGGGGGGGGGRGAATRASTMPAVKVPDAVADSLSASAKWSLVDGEADGNSAELSVLGDGKVGENNDDPRSSFFFGTGTLGGRIVADLGDVKEIGQINSYSWHTGGRAPQVYKVWVADGKDMNFDASPKLFKDPEQFGWTLLTRVDTRQRRGGGGGKVTVSLNDTDNIPLAEGRYVMFDVERTGDDGNGNTFFSEIDIVAPDKVVGKTLLKGSDAPKYRIKIDTRGLSEEMADWARKTMEPVCKEWYPKLADMLPSEGYSAPKTFTIRFLTDMGDTPASAGGNMVNCNLPWFEKNRDGEGVGAVVHEMVHVVQNYRGWRSGGGGGPVPFWLQEGIPDYIRWYLYEPEKNGAVIRDKSKAKYDAAYRTSANFLNFVSNTYGKDIVPKVNALIRDGKYSDDIWKELCKGKDLKQLDAEWKAALEAGTIK